MGKAKLKETTPKLTSDLGKRASAAIKNHKDSRGIELVKFGKSHYLHPMFTKGKLRIQAASSFSNPSHNSAVGDNELKRKFKVAISAAEIKSILDSHGVRDAPDPIDSPEIEVEYFTDYWVTCFSRFLHPRMSVDFEADSALVIYNKHEFHRRLRNAARRVIKYSSMLDGPVQYFDPYMPSKVNFRAIPLIKPLKYYYQHEYRYVWLPESPTDHLNYIEVEMGSLEDIASILSWVER